MERLNQTLCNILNYTIYENPFDWDEVIRLCTLTYNSSIQESTGQTPYFMVYGRLKNYNNRLKETPYKVGSLVYYHNPVKGNSGKERFYKWRGLFVVVTKISERIYRLQENINSHPLKANHDRLKPAHKRKEVDTSWAHTLRQPVPKVVLPSEAEQILEENLRPNEDNQTRLQRTRKSPDWYGHKIPDTE